jgi:hypothetical protein
VIVKESPAGADRQHILQFMTTEHFTLQTARAVANAEISSRLQLYLSTLSSTIIALALVAQLSELGRAFTAFALVLLPVVYFLGVVTLGRVLQASSEWRIYGQGMNRIRHYYLEIAPQMQPYFVLPATDDPRGQPGGGRHRRARQGLVAGAAHRPRDDRGHQQRPGRRLRGPPARPRGFVGTHAAGHLGSGGVRAQHGGPGRV